MNAEDARIVALLKEHCPTEADLLERNRELSSRIEELEAEVVAFRKAKGIRIRSREFSIPITYTKEEIERSLRESSKLMPVSLRNRYRFTFFSGSRHE